MGVTAVNTPVKLGALSPPATKSPPARDSVLDALERLRQEQEETNRLLRRLLVPVTLISRCCSLLLDQVQRLVASCSVAALLLEDVSANLRSIFQHTSYIANLVSGATAAAAYDSLLGAHADHAANGLRLASAACLLAAAGIALPYDWAACGSKHHYAQQQQQQVVWFRNWRVIFASGGGDVAAAATARMRHAAATANGNQSGDAMPLLLTNWRLNVRRQFESWWLSLLAFSTGLTTQGGGSSGGSGDDSSGRWRLLGLPWLLRPQQASSSSAPQHAATCSRSEFGSGYGFISLLGSWLWPQSAATAVLPVALCRLAAVCGFTAGALLLAGWVAAGLLMQQRKTHGSASASATSARAVSSTMNTASAITKGDGTTPNTNLRTEVLTSAAAATAPHCNSSNNRRPRHLCVPSLPCAVSPGACMAMWLLSARLLLTHAPAWCAALGLMHGSWRTWLLAQLMWHAVLPYAVAMTQPSTIWAAQGTAATTAAEADVVEVTQQVLLRRALPLPLMMLHPHPVAMPPGVLQDKQQQQQKERKDKQPLQQQEKETERKDKQPLQQQCQQEAAGNEREHIQQQPAVRGSHEHYIKGPNADAQPRSAQQRSAASAQQQQQHKKHRSSSGSITRRLRRALFSCAFGATTRTDFAVDSRTQQGRQPTPTAPIIMEPAAPTGSRTSSPDHLPMESRTSSSGLVAPLVRMSAQPAAGCTAAVAAGADRAPPPPVPSAKPPSDSLPVTAVASAAGAPVLPGILAAIDAWLVIVKQEWLRCLLWQWLPTRMPANMSVAWLRVVVSAFWLYGMPVFTGVLPVLPWRWVAAQVVRMALAVMAVAVAVTVGLGAFTAAWLKVRRGGCCSGGGRTQQ
ncbi:hypothetical protein Agub_g10669 [Astrephomene gubernaculifera]|uniref:Uncharacterized protein n=1 Tax=Astrephomene gubernaculifera TaxID=47775 RepID=A0AAD3HQ50_9CHLO|nr:hypothetical protein Agub_g10669 [Astrephomene gubernaculifera]